MRYVGAWLLAFGGVVLAQEPAPDRVPRELRSCVGIERNTERLACFDRGVAALLGARGAAAPTAESTFGLVAHTPRPAATPSAEGAADLQSVSGRIAALGGTAEGAVLVTLDNGQVWRQISGGQLLLKVGDEVRIDRAALGSFQMKVPSGRSGKVKRVR